jgi:transcriptional regulator with XRE-family HTH domain
MQISRYEKGQSLPSFDTATRLATALQVSLDLLVSGSEIPSPRRHSRTRKCIARMQELDALPEDRQELALRLLDAVIAGELDALATRLRHD